MNRSLYEQLLAYCKSDAYPFHMPGHKRRLLSFADPFSFDLTEIDGFDNLHHAEGVIREAEKRAAALYHSEETHFLVNGSTSGILSAIGACARKGEVLLMARNSHKASYNALALNHLKVRYLYPEEGGMLHGRIKPQEVERALKEGLRETGEKTGRETQDRKENLGKRDTEVFQKYPLDSVSREKTGTVSDLAGETVTAASSCPFCAVYLTSPTYDGIVSDVASIAEIAHSYGLPLIVDEAHGAHFGMHPLFPPSSVSLGADLVIHSVHKTLPSLTQTALIHVNGNLVDRRALRQELSTYQTSSPSYILMASIDACIQLLTDQGAELFDDFALRLRIFYESIGIQIAGIYPGTGLSGELSPPSGGLSRWKNWKQIEQYNHTEHTVLRDESVQGEYAEHTDHALREEKGSGEKRAGGNDRGGNDRGNRDHIDHIDKRDSSVKRYNREDIESGGRAEAMELKHVRCFPADDLSKISLMPDPEHLTSRALYDLLRDRYDLQPEMCTPVSVLMLTSAADTAEGFERLSKALHEIDAEIEAKAEEKSEEKTGERVEERSRRTVREELWTASEDLQVCHDERMRRLDFRDRSRKEKGSGIEYGIMGEDKKEIQSGRGHLPDRLELPDRPVFIKSNEMDREPIPDPFMDRRLFSVDMVLTISETRRREQEAVSLGASAGRISGEYLYLYPPGIPLLCPGERISEHLLKRIQSLREEGFELEGLEDHQLERIFVVK